MMKNYLFTIVLILSLSISCNQIPNNQDSTDSPEVLQNQTPEVLNDKTDYGLSSVSRKKKYDIISKLYKEAIEKNAKLNQLNEEINGIYKFKKDSLEVYKKYDNTNDSYWMSAQNYIRSIKDSILRESTKETFDLLEMNYRSRMIAYEQKLETINEKAISLNDQLVLMKLFVTAPMIRNYQVNEIPNIQTLENIIKEYDKLIKESDEFTRIEE